MHIVHIIYRATSEKKLQPANVLVSSSGRVKLADFGIVSQWRPNDNVDSDGTIMNSTVVGTTRYMSPERLRGGQYTRSSDVWGVGLLLLEMARGTSPFEDVTSVVSRTIIILVCFRVFFAWVRVFRP
jgi:serine/threonine protein kinase